MAKRKRPVRASKSKEQPPKAPRKGLQPLSSPDNQWRMYGATRGGDSTPATPLQQADDLVYRAYEEPDLEKRVQLAQQALAVCPDCAGAYTLLAEHAPKRKTAAQLYAQGVAAAERALGGAAFQRDAGHFWLVHETRPYMRARLGLAHALWGSGRHEEAAQHLQEMLRLNPHDNQGVRYTLAGFLLFLDRDADLAALLERYPDDGAAAWAYTKALLTFRREGDTIAARRLLKAARRVNKHVPDYLLGEDHLPAEPPPYYSPGDEDEAIEYIGGSLSGWKSTAGAVAWVRANVTPKRPKAPTPAGPLELAKKRLQERLPQEEDIWEAGLLQLPMWIARSGATPTRPWVVSVISASRDLVLANEIIEEEPSAALLWDTVAAAMQHPTVGARHRPAELRVLAHPRWEELKPHFADIGIRVAVCDALEVFTAVIQDMVDHVAGPVRAGFLDVAGVTPAQVAVVYEAAAFFFRQAPWKKIGDETAIRIECNQFENGVWYAIITGQSGLLLGFTLYPDLQELQRLRAGRSEDNAMDMKCLNVSFSEEWDISVADLEAAKKHDWTVARPDAHPLIFAKDRGKQPRPPEPRELEMAEACLRAIPEFVGRRRQDDPTKETIAITVGPKRLELVLSWVADDEW